MLKRKPKSNSDSLQSASITLPFHLPISPQAAVSELSPIGFAGLSSTGGKLSVESVQSSTLSNAPHHYIRAKFSKDEVVLEYTHSSSSKTARAAEAAGWLMQICSSFGKRAEFHPKFISFVSDALREASVQLSENPDSAAAKLASLQSEHAQLSQKYSRLASEHEAQARSAVESARQLEERTSRLSLLEAPSNETLDEEVMEWLGSHGGRINVREFARMRSISPSVVEESLERLSRGGHIARI